MLEDIILCVLFPNNKKQCSVFDYEILGGGITGTNEEAENRSSNSDKDINVYPNPTSGPVELDLQGYLEANT